MNGYKDLEKKSKPSKQAHSAMCEICNYDSCICLKTGKGVSEEERKQKQKDAHGRYYCRTKEKRRDYQNKYKKGELEWQQNHGQQMRMIETLQLTLVIVNKK